MIAGKCILLPLWIGLKNEKHARAYTPVVANWLELSYFWLEFISSKNSNV